MGKLLGYLGLGFGILFSIGIIAMVVLQLTQADSPSPRSTLQAGETETGVDVRRSDDTQTDAFVLDADAATELAGLGFRVFSSPPQAEDFSLPLLNAEHASTEELRLSSLEGKLVLVNFWATWCPPCIEEMPSMQRLYESLPRDRFEIIAVNMQEDRGTVARFIDQHEFTYPILLDVNGTVARRYAVRGLPTSYLIAPDASMPAALLGFAHWDDPNIITAFRHMLNLE